MKENLLIILFFALYPIVLLIKKFVKEGVTDNNLFLMILIGYIILLFIMIFSDLERINKLEKRIEKLEKGEK